MMKKRTKGYSYNVVDNLVTPQKLKPPTQNSGLVTPLLTVYRLSRGSKAFLGPCTTPISKKNQKNNNLIFQLNFDYSRKKINQSVSKVS